ncbi:uncharacterized protein LOC122510734 isoform X2 [Leptopilina heterotoma]|uniref:uncharacterized protein LOC122510734 isoform X2 n=1 Tax=Leptopilina heterotoma TaxID=63436 RepID=UPI001CA8251A|nr:uncharacterized protein LOC122510734 isoform X2 [Leptopilina heterotoma]
MAQTFAHSIIVTNVTSDGPRLKIWGVCEKEKYSYIETLIAELGNEFMQRQGLGPQNALSSETTCCVKYRGKFVRAKITNIHRNGVIVLLIDSGVTDIVPVEVVKLLYPNSKEEDYLIKCPPLANEFTLANVLSVNEKWDVRTVETIRILVKDKELSVSKFEKFNSCYLVKLVLGEHDIGNLLVNKGMAKMTTLDDMFKPQMYPQQQTYKMPMVPHQQQMPVTQMPISGYPCEQRVMHPQHANMMPVQQNMNTVNLHYARQQPGYAYQQQQQHQQQPPPHVHQSAPIHQTKISPRKPKVHEDDDEDSRSDIFEFRTRLVQVGMKYPAHVSCVEDGPIKFSVQLEENREQLVSLMTELQAHTPSPLKGPLLPGSVCLARLKEERSLCRAVVMSTFDTRVKIYFVDFGNTDYVQYTDIYRLPPRFIKPKVLSIRICLPGLREMNITEEVKNYFVNLVYGKKVELHVCEPDGPFLIQYGDIFLCGQNVKDYLKNRFPDISSVTYGHIPALTDGTKEIVFVSHTVSCSKFFIQLEKNASDLEKMMDNINEYAITAPQLKKIDINSLCIAPYEVDERWYRVKILKSVGDKVNVLYVDYGNEETVNVNQLRTISKDLVTQMPSQAMLCVLNGFQSRNSKPEFDSAFETLTNDKRLQMTVKNAQKTCLVVDLFDLSTTPMKNILMEINQMQIESKPVDNVAGKKSNEVEKTPPQNHQRDEANVSTQSNTTNPFRANSDDNSRNRTKSWKDDHNEQRHDNRYQQRDDSDRNGKSGNFNRDGPNRSFNRDGGGNNPFGRSGDDDGNKKDGESSHFNRDARNERFNNRDSANNSFERDGGNDRFNRDGGNDRFNRDGGNDRYNRDGGNDRFNRTGGNDRFNKDGNDRFNRDRGNDRFNRDGGNDRFNKDGNDRFNKDGNDRFNKDGNDRFNRDGGNDRFNRSAGNDRFNKDGAKPDRNFRDGGRFNQYSQHDDRTGGNKFSKSYASDNESTSSKGSGKRGEKGGGFQRKNDRDFKSNQFNKFGNDNDGFKPRNHDDNNRFNSKPKYGRDNSSNEPKEINFDEPIDFSKSKTLEFALPSIIPGNKQRGEIIYLSNLSNFFVHLIPDNEKLEELMEKIAVIYESGGVVLDKSKVKLNIPCIAQYADDERWYRAVIQKIDGTNATVLFVDYGNVEVVCFNKLKEIRDEFTSLPIQAVPCKLFGPEKTEWTEEEINDFSDIVNGKLLEIEFIGKDQDTFKVLLREVIDETAKKEIINSTFCPGVDLTKSKENTSVTKITNVSQQKIDFASFDSKWVDERVKPGTKDTVIVTWFDNTDSFYCQSVTKQKEFRPMMEEIQKVYSGRKTINETLKPGCPVMAIFAQDDALYRAEIIEIKGNRSYLVQYVDFGNKATVEQRQLYPVEKRFMIIPKQGIRCSLKDIFPVDGGSWTNRNSQGVEQYLYDEGEFECTYHEEKDNKYLISLSHNKIDVVKALVEKNHAMFSTPASAPKSIEPEKVTTEEPSCDISRLDIELLPGQTLRVKVSSVESVSKFHIQFSSANYCDEAISSYMENNDPKVLALPSQLAVMQNQAIECALHNVNPSPTLDERLKKLVLNQEVIIYVESVDKNRLIVELYDSIGCKIQFNDNNPDVKIPPVCPMPILSSTHKVSVSCANHSNSLWLQMASDAKKDEKLNRELSEFYAKKGEIADAVENKLCVIESSGTFSRAKIIKKTDDRQVFVNLIDYGMNENIACDKLKVLEPSFHVPHQLAIHVSLNVTLDGSPSEQVNALKPHLIGKEFTAIFYNVRKKWVVELIENGVKLSETLKELNLVKEVTEVDSGVKIPGGERFKCHVSHADSPAQFWIQRDDEISQLKELQSELQRSVASYQAVDKVLEEGSLCAVCSDNVWYRAEIIDADEEITTARFIDYGKTDIISTKPENLKQLSDSMKGKKVFGIKCRLDVLPIDSEEWSDAICKWMQSLKTLNLEAGLIVDGVPKRIDLYIDGKSVIDRLVEEGKAVKMHQDDELVEELVDVELDPRSAFISHINSLSDFYIQEEKSVSNLEKIQDRFLVADMLPKVTDVKEGTLCVAKFTDGDWYRARVLAPGETGTKVLFIDYGNNAEVTEIRAIPEDVASIPPLARWCSLLKPYYATKWPQGAFDTFCELSADGATIFLLDVLVEAETAIVKLTLENEDIAEKLAPAVSICVSNINSTEEFWVQKEKEIDEIEGLQEKLLEAGNYGKIDEIKEGLLCAAKYPDDEQWYRGRIVKHSGNETVVLFIDYGNSSTCTEIRELPKEIAEIGAFAKKCSLKLPSTSDEWSQTAFNDFCNISGDGAVALLLDVIEENDTAVVNLFFERENIAKKLISKKEKTAEKLTTIEEDVKEQEAVPEVESAPEKETAPKETPKETVPEEIVPKETVSKETVPEAIVSKETVPEEIVSKETVSEKTVSEESVPEAAPQQKKLEIQNKVAFISQLNSLQEFWVQREDLSDDLYNLGSDLEVLEKDPKITDPKESSVYAALFPEDEAWYRGKVISKNGTETEVLFIDYGNTSLVKELRELSEELKKLTPFARKCSLKLPENLSEWPKEAQSQLCEFSADGTCAFTVQVLEEGDPAVVDLKLNDESVTEKLLESIRASGKMTEEKEVEEEEEKNADEKNEEVTPKIDDVPASVEETAQDDGTILLGNIISPSEFWGQVGGNLDNVQRQLSKACEWRSLDDLTLALVCAGKVDDEWHRVRIESLKEKEAEVFLIDQGYTRICTQFHQLPSSLVNDPPLSKKFSLQLPKNLKKWSQAATTAFSKYSKSSLSMEILETGEVPIIKLSLNDEDVAEILASIRDDSSHALSEGISEENSTMAITNIISPSMFSGQTESDLAKLDEVYEHLANVESFHQLKNFDVGRMCAAKFPDDGNWYRAKILSHSDDATEVIYVDFGNRSKVTELRALPQDLIEMDYLSTQYSLRKPSDIVEWSKEACDKFFDVNDDGATSFEFKILDLEKKEVGLIYQGTDVVELLSPLCSRETVEEKRETEKDVDEKNVTSSSDIVPDSEKVASTPEVIDLTEENTSLKENVDEKNVTISSDSAFHSENVDSSHDMENIEIEKKSQEFSSTFDESQQNDESLKREGSEKPLCPELTPEDIIAQMTPTINESVDIDSLNVKESDAPLSPELTPDDIIGKMTPVLNDSAIDDNTLSETQVSVDNAEQKSICEAEDNIETSSVTSASTASEKTIGESKESNETTVTVINSENIKEALPEVEIIDNCKSNEAKIGTELENQSTDESKNLAHEYGHLITECSVVLNDRRLSLPREEKILPGTVSGEQSSTLEEKNQSHSVNESVPLNETTTDDELVSEV